MPVLIGLVGLGAAAADAAERVTLVPVPEGGKPAAARVDAEGAVHLVFNTADGPRHARSTDGGRTFAASVPVIDRRASKVDPRLKFEAWDMAVGPGGRVHVAMGTNAWKLKLPQNEWGFYLATLEPGGSAFSAVRNVNNKPSEGYSLAADDKGNLAAVWLSGKLFADLSRDSGKTFGPNAEINRSLDPCDCCTTSAVYGADGKLAVLYREETRNERDMYLVLWDTQRGQSTRTRISSTLWKIPNCPMTYYSITRSPSGYTAVWPTRNQIYFARIDAKGNLMPPGEIKTPGTSGMRTAMTALNAPDGSTLVVWVKDGRQGRQLYDAAGRPVGPPGSAATSGDGAAGIVDKDGNFILFH